MCVKTAPHITYSEYLVVPGAGMSKTHITLVQHMIE
jgi:hypothetical protein